MTTEEMLKWLNDMGDKSLYGEYQFEIVQAIRAALRERDEFKAERDRLKDNGAYCLRELTRERRRHEETKARLAALSRVAGELLDGGLGPFVGEGGVIEFLKRIRDLAGEGKL